MTYNAERRVKGDKYPGIHHPAVKAVHCPTCSQPKGKPCILMHLKDGTSVRRTKTHTRTHKTRLNLWRVKQQRKAGYGRKGTDEIMDVDEE